MSATATKPAIGIEKHAYEVWEVLQREVSKRGLALIKHKPFGDGRVMLGTIGGVIKALNSEREWGLDEQGVDQTRRYLKATGNVVALEKVEQYRFRIFVRETWHDGLLPATKAPDLRVGKTPEEKLTPKEAGEDRPPQPVTYRCKDCGREFQKPQGLAGHRSSCGTGEGKHQPAVRNPRNPLTPRNQRVLRHIADQGGEVTDKHGFVAPTIAKELGMPRPGVSAALQALDAGGYLDRDLRHTKRTHRVSLTSDGWAALDRKPAIIRSVSVPATEPEPAPAGTLTEASSHDLLEELRTRLVSPDELAACRDRLTLIGDLVREVNAGTLAPLKALADIEVAVNL